jgi:hypothetical protein
MYGCWHGNDDVFIVAAMIIFSGGFGKTLMKKWEHHKKYCALLQISTGSLKFSGASFEGFLLT